MHTTQTRKGTDDDGQPRPLVLHIRRHRQWYEKRSLTQSDLARLAGISIRHLERYETLRELPSALDTALRLARALRISVEALIAPDTLDEITAEIEAQREHLGLADADDEYQNDAE